MYSLSARRSSSSVRQVSPQARPRRREAKPDDIGQPQEDELAQLKLQLARVTSDLEKCISTVNMHSATDGSRAGNVAADHSFAQAVQDSLGEAALSPVRARPSEPASFNVAQDQLSDQMAVLAAAKARAIERHGAEKDVWDRAMHRRIMPAGQGDSEPAQGEGGELESDMAASVAASLLTAAQENSAFLEAERRKAGPSAHEKLSGLAASSAAFGPGLQHIINGVPSSEQSSDMQLLIREIASLKNEVLIIKDTRPGSAVSQQPSDFSNLDAMIMRVVDQDHLSLIHEDFVITVDVLRSCLRPGCNAVQVPGSLTCVCAAPRNMLDFRCPDNACHMSQVGSITQMLTQYECR